MTTEEEEQRRGPDGEQAEGSEAQPRLRAVRGPVATEDAPEAPPPVRLRREFKGLTVADLLRDEVVDSLPGQVRSALEHIERGDLAAAERALPGHFATVLEGPGHRRRSRPGWLVVVGLAAVVVGALLTGWLLS